MSAFRYLQERLSLTPSKAGKKVKPEAGTFDSRTDAPFEKIYHYEAEQENNAILANTRNASMAVSSTFPPQEVAFVQKLVELVIVYQEATGNEAPVKLQQALGGFPRSTTPSHVVKLQSVVCELKGKIPGKPGERKAKRLLQKYAHLGVILCETDKACFSVQLTDQAREDFKRGELLSKVQLFARAPLVQEKIKVSSNCAKTARTKKNRKTGRGIVNRTRRPEGERVLARLCHASVNRSALGVNRVVFLAPGEFVNSGSAITSSTAMPSILDDFEMIDIERC